MRFTHDIINIEIPIHLLFIFDGMIPINNTVNGKLIYQHKNPQIDYGTNHKNRKRLYYYYQFDHNLMLGKNRLINMKPHM